jgi:hypothetical protein
VILQLRKQPTQTDVMETVKSGRASASMKLEELLSKKREVRGCKDKQRKAHTAFVRFIQDTNRKAQKGAGT